MFSSSRRTENHRNGIPTRCDGIRKLLCDFNHQPCDIRLKLTNADQPYRVKATRKGSLLHANDSTRKIEDQTVRLIQPESFVCKLTRAIHTHLGLLIFPAQVDLLNHDAGGILHSRLPCSLT